MTLKGSTGTLGRIAEEHLSLYLLPLAVTTFAFIKARTAASWIALAYGTWVVVGLIALLLSGMFTLNNVFLLRLRMRWWHNILLSAGFLGVSVVILLGLLRL